MAPSNIPSRHGDDHGSRALQRGTASSSIARSEVTTSASSHNRRNDESWVEIASQPSSSSLSSIGDEIVTTGLRVGNSAYAQRRRRSHQPQAMPSYIANRAATYAGTSSQEEYDESESEEDHVLTSSTEHIHPTASLPRLQTVIASRVDSDSDEDDDDENATALGRPSNSPTFRPQPNAFSHPPSNLAHRHSTSSSFPHQSHPRSSNPNRSHTRPHRGPSNFMSPSYQADNDAALRASLTTLLSCAAAARGLPKNDDKFAGPSTAGGLALGAGVGVIPSSQPMELRLVPESELMAEPAAKPAVAPRQATPRTASNSSAPSAPSSTSSREREADKAKRAAASSQTKPQRVTKKKRTGSAVVEGEGYTYISPTLLTWVVSAGVVVLVSVVSFGAGYVMGREVGRQEGALSMGSASAATNASASCGNELVRSTPGGTLRRFRWGAVGRSVVA